MSDDDQPQVPPPYPGPDPAAQHQPNWGSAYPPPGAPQPPPGQYPPAPGQYQPPPGQYAPYQAPPKHPSATTAMVLGIVAVAGGLACYLPVFAAPFAWYQGAKAMREIDASQGHVAMGGRSEAKAGFILGIIGTVILALMLAVVTLLIVLTLTVDDFWDDEYFIRGAFAALHPIT